LAEESGEGDAEGGFGVYSGGVGGQSMGEDDMHKANTSEKPSLGLWRAVAIV